MSNAIPIFFKQFVSNIESPIFVRVFLEFKDRDELQKCASFYLDRVIANPILLSRYVTSAEKFRYVTSVNGDTRLNFQKALTVETIKRIDEIVTSFSGGNVTPEPKALTTVTFAGKIFNEQFFTMDELKYMFECFSITKDEYLTSYKCYYLLVDTIKESVLKEPFTHSRIHRELLDIIELSKNPSKPPSAAVLQIGKSNFPGLSSTKQRVEMKTFEESIEIFKAKIDSLNPVNSQTVLQNVSGADVMYHEDRKWQKYYEILIEKALVMPEVALCVAKLCMKISKSQGDPKKKIESEEYKKYIQATIISNFEKSFDNGNNNLAYSLLNFIEKLLDQSLCSLKCISSFFDVLIDNSRKNEVFASRSMIQLVYIVKRKVTSEKFQNLPEERRVKIIEMISHVKGATDLQEIASYLGVKVPGSKKRKEIRGLGEASSSSSSSSSISSPGTSFIESQVNEASSGMLQNISKDNQINTKSDRYKDKEANVEDSRKSSITEKKSNHPVSADLTRLKSLVDVFTNILKFGWTAVFELQIEEFGVIEENELEFMIELSLRKTIKAQLDLPLDRRNYQALAHTIGIIKTKIGTPRVFQETLEKKLKKLISNCFTPQHDQRDETFAVTVLISELYVIGLINCETIYSCMNLFFKHELDEKCGLKCIELMIITIGSQVSIDKQKLFDRYFLYFESLDDDGSFRVDHYKVLISLRKRWIATPVTDNYSWSNDFYLKKAFDLMADSVRGKKDPIPFPYFDEGKNPSEVKTLPNPTENDLKIPSSASDSIPTSMSRSSGKDEATKPGKINTNDQKPEPVKPATTKSSAISIKFNDETMKDKGKLQKYVFDLKSKLSTPQRTEDFVAKLLSHALKYKSLISQCVVIFREMKKLDDDFTEILTEKLVFSYASTLKDSEIASRSNLFIIFAELYCEGVLGDENLSIWTQKYMKDIAHDDLSYVSSIISPRVNEIGGDHIKMLVDTLEKLIHTKTMEDFSTMEKEMGELVDAVKLIMKAYPVKS